jgi:hypothetical protein
VKEKRRGIPDGAICAWSAPGDVDGDGDLETISTYGKPDGYGYGEGGGGEDGALWFLSVQEPHQMMGLPLEEPPTSSFMVYEPRLMGTVDADGDGASEIFVALEVGNGASVGIFTLEEDGLHRVLAGDQRFLFSVAASAAHRMGMSCATDPDGSRVLLVREAEATEAGYFVVTTSRYLWESGTLRPDGSSRERAEGEDQLVRRSQAVDCFGFEWSL